MLNVDDLLISYHAWEAPGLARLYELSKQSSVVPEGFHPMTFASPPMQQEYAERRGSLDRPPDEEAALQKELTYSGIRKERRKSRVRQHEIASQFYRPPPTMMRPDERRIAFGTSVLYVQLLQWSRRLGPLTEAVEAYFGRPCTLQGDFYYPRGGFREWHTNKYDAPGWRLYIVDAQEPRKSYFRIKTPSTGEIYTHWDEPGTFNFFRIDPEHLMWHCIGSDTNRWSKGFVVPDDWRDTVEKDAAAKAAG